MAASNDCDPYDSDESSDPSSDEKLPALKKEKSWKTTVPVESLTARLQASTLAARLVFRLACRWP